MNKKNYTIRLKELCQEKGITQKELSRRVGVSEVTLVNIGKGSASLTSLSRIADELEVELWQLFTPATERVPIAFVADKGAFRPVYTPSELRRFAESLCASVTD